MYFIHIVTMALRRRMHTSNKYIKFTKELFLLWYFVLWFYSSCDICVLVCLK